ncbi:3347_t:CDS:2, partial [Acaulospora colombiana]
TRSFASSPDDKKSYDGDTNDNGDFDVNQLPVENFFDDDSRRFITIWLFLWDVKRKNADETNSREIKINTEQIRNKFP